MVEGIPVLKAGEIAMALLGKDIPAVGPRLKTKSEAMMAVKKYVSEIEKLLSCSQLPYSLIFLRQPDGRYTLAVKGSGEALELLPNFDEITVKRFQRFFKKKIFILTTFFEEGDQLECLALTEGLGAVMYIPW